MHQTTHSQIPPSRKYAHTPWLLSSCSEALPLEAPLAVLRPLPGLRHLGLFHTGRAWDMDMLLDFTQVCGWRGGGWWGAGAAYQGQGHWLVHWLVLTI
jgi:hypothetical protein